MGASLAFQDARILAQELATGHPESFTEPLARFKERRRGDATHVAREARVEATMMLLDSEHLRQLRDMVAKYTPLFDLFIKRRTTET